MYFFYRTLETLSLEKLKMTCFVEQHLFNHDKYKQSCQETKREK